VNPPAATPRGRRIRLTPEQASVIASNDLGRRIPPGTIRQWRFRDIIAGGRGWVDGEDLLHFCTHPERWPGTGLPRSA
jgi:hypothetical protein